MKICIFYRNNQSGGNRNYPSFKQITGSVESMKDSSTCAYCTKPGRNLDKWYMINWFPPDYKFTNQRKFKPQDNNVYRTADETYQGGNGFSNGKTLTPKNIGKLLQLLQQFKTGHQSDKNVEATTSANWAGLKRFFNSYAFFVKIDTNSWIFDTGASEQMNFNKHLLSNFKPSGNPIMVTHPNSHKVKVTHLWFC